MSWDVSPQTRVTLRIAGEVMDVSSMSSSEIKNTIIAKARELGWRRIKVAINGVEVSPTEFESKLEELKNQGVSEIVIDVTKLDVAGI